VGSPCPERACSRRGLHRIPEEWHRRHQGRGPDRIDPVIGRRIDDHLVVDLLGRGGFGKVYLVLQAPLWMKAALKLMEPVTEDPEMARALARKFEGEARALARLSHPNVVRLHKYGTVGDLPYLVMEYVEGRTLTSEMGRLTARGERMPPAVLRHVLEQVINALEAAHSLDIIHRDIKPDNVMIQAVPGDPHFVRVLDFGLAKFLESQRDTSLLLGTPTFMAPEQITREAVGPWTDLYAVGVLAFELLTGKRPFEGETPQEIIAKKLDPDHDPLDPGAGPEVPDALREFLRRAIHRDPEKRFRQAARFREAMEEAFRQWAEGPADDRTGGKITVPAGEGAGAVAGPGTTGRVPEVRETVSAPPREPRPNSEASPRRRRGGAAAGLAILATVAVAGVIAWRLGVFRGPSGPEAASPAAAAVVDAGPDGTEGASGAIGAASPTEAGVDAPPGFVEVPAGEFLMGSPDDEAGRKADEGPQRWVRIPRPFWIRKTEVTQGEWQALMKNNPSSFRSCGPDCPVENVSWWDAVAWCNALSRRDGLEECYRLKGCRGRPGETAYRCAEARFLGPRCKGYRLPTEAEWEYAARGGSIGPHYGEIDAVAWYQGNSGGAPRPVGGKRPNAFGLYDMLGNVWEWTQDGYRDSYEGAPLDGSAVEASQAGARSHRGGSWILEARSVRAAVRHGGDPDLRYYGLGLRPVRSIPGPP